MNKCHWILPVLLALSVGASAGCGEKKAPSADPVAAAQASGAVANPTESQAVLTALEKKDYDGVVAGLLRMKQAAGTVEQQTQFAAFVDDVKLKLLDEAPTDPKAAEALAALRQLTGGR